MQANDDMVPILRAPLVTRLSGDAFAAIAAWLPSEALCALVLSGDKQLNRMLSHNVSSLNHYNKACNFS